MRTKREFWVGGHHGLPRAAALVGIAVLVASCSSAGGPDQPSHIAARVAPAAGAKIHGVVTRAEPGRTEISGQVRPLWGQGAIYFAHIDLRLELPDGRVLEQPNVRIEKMRRSPPLQNRDTRAAFYATFDMSAPANSVVHVVYHKDPHFQ